MGNSKVEKLTALQLESLVRGTPLRFVYLGGCQGTPTVSSSGLPTGDFLGAMDGLVMGGVPAVLGLRWPVSGDGARLLTSTFYAAWLNEGKRRDEALLVARRTVADHLGRDDRTWFSPVLAMRTTEF